MMNCLFSVMIGTQLAVCIHPDATVSYGPDVNTAAKAFWQEVAKQMPDDMKNCPPKAM